LSYLGESKMLRKKILVLILIVLTFLSPVVAINIDLEITSQDYQKRYCNNILNNHLNNSKNHTSKDHDIECDDSYQVATIKTIEMDCNSVHTSKLSLNGADKKDSKISILTKPKFGKFKINCDGTFTYLPYTDYCGMDSFCYSVTTNEESKISQIKFNIQIND
jgi:hypothetical protein